MFQLIGIVVAVIFGAVACSDNDDGLGPPMRPEPEPEPKPELKFPLTSKFVQDTFSAYAKTNKDFVISDHCYGFGIFDSKHLKSLCFALKDDVLDMGERQALKEETAVQKGQGEAVSVFSEEFVDGFAGSDGTRPAHERMVKIMEFLKSQEAGKDWHTWEMGKEMGELYITILNKTRSFESLKALRGEYPQIVKILESLQGQEYSRWTQRLFRKVTVTPPIPENETMEPATYPVNVAYGEPLLKRFANPYFNPRREGSDGWGTFGSEHFMMVRQELSKSIKKWFDFDWQKLRRDRVRSDGQRVRTYSPEFHRELFGLDGLRPAKRRIEALIDFVRNKKGNEKLQVGWIKEIAGIYAAIHPVQEIVFYTWPKEKVRPIRRHFIREVRPHLMDLKSGSGVSEKIQAAAMETIDSVEKMYRDR